ncbi:MAG: Guanine deaminase [Candidatus Daviesbacteria bacterium GW2011_GWA2_38_24]|uniref:Guanine deaminase n=1 Tax=Candidatus Daviesbacteria bacterium GW2011_GWA2_38_24 TaxID=1618422 RepID=A0A0G0MPU4_9BACT|nr:MAG: Guanine deaminase [Candidatus Daviesbacteria bacterium GW2011_GWA2_38_24]KKQ79974.1 MAG: Guanine deaminase [Candidatus Daviesbacteria bacterium GW2011_GWA1_38_7]OGE23243.1 MAG: hypothetical protein A2688_02645 [Candidatus Daviesbacteria bacterium RIFCSPHIGHO2_01_FULL_38_8]
MEDDKKFLLLAIEQAKKSVKEGGFPAGALLVKNSEIISEGISIGNKLHDPTSHAETVSIRNACQKLETSDLKGATLYGSLQPCTMCFSVANWAGISRVVYAARKTEDMVIKGYYEGKTNINVVNDDNKRKIEILFMPDYEQESLLVVKDWEVANGI